MPAETPNLGNEGEPQEQPQESFEDWQKRQQAKKKGKEEESEGATSEVDPYALSEEEIAGLLSLNLERQKQSIVPQEIRSAGREEVDKLNEVISKFEVNHSLESLNEIIDVSPEFAKLSLQTVDMVAQGQFEEIEAEVAKLSPDEVEKYRMRESARGDINLIRDQLKTLENKMVISPEEYQKLNAKYKQFSRAFGIINNNKIDHSR